MDDSGFIPILIGILSTLLFADMVGTNGYSAGMAFALSCIDACVMLLFAMIFLGDE